MRLCLHRAVVAAASPPTDEERGLLLDLVEALTALPPPSTEGQEAALLLAWRILLGLAVEEGDPSSPLPRLSVGGGASFQARLRREMGLPSLLRSELAKVSAGRPSPRALGVVWRLACTAAGLPSASSSTDASSASDTTTTATTPALPEELLGKQQRATGQLAQALLSTPRLLTDPALAPLVAPLRQGGAKGLWRVLAAWDERQQQEVQQPPPPPGKDEGSTEEAAALVRVQNLLELTRLLLQQPPSAAREVAALVRALEYSVRRVPLVAAAGAAGGADGSAAAAAAVGAGAARSPMEVDDEDEEEEEGGVGAAGGDGGGRRVARRGHPGGAPGAGAGGARGPEGGAGGAGGAARVVWRAGAAAAL